jgi:hypothetical protein
MKSKWFILLVLSLVISGCASVNKRNQAETINQTDSTQKLSLSYEINKPLSSEHFGLIELNFQNPGDKWVAIKNIELIIEDNSLAESVRLTSGLEFDNWRKAMRKQIAISNHNTSMLVSGLLLASAVASADSNETVSAAGTIGLGVTLGSHTVREISADIDRVEANGLFPQTHLLATPEKVPPTLFLDKWLLVDTSDVAQDRVLRKLEVKVTYADSTEDLYVINIDNYKDRKFVNNWQKQKVIDINKSR